MKAIEEIEVSDEVLSYDEETGTQEYKPVVRLFRNESKEWIGVTVKGEEIVSTPWHKYYIPESREWKCAKELQAGEKVLLKTGKYVKIQTVRKIIKAEPETTYNFEVADNHTYYVGNGILTHNKCDNIPDLYRGGKKMDVRRRDVEILDDLVQPTRGLSVNSNPNAVASFGGAYKIGTVPSGLKIVYTGGTHYEIVPKYAMSLSKYQNLINKIQLII